MGSSTRNFISYFDRTWQDLLRNISLSLSSGGAHAQATTGLYRPDVATGTLLNYFEIFESALDATNNVLSENTCLVATTVIFCSGDTTAWYKNFTH